MDVWARPLALKTYRIAGYADRTPASLAAINVDEAEGRALADAGWRVYADDFSKTAKLLGADHYWPLEHDLYDYAVGGVAGTAMGGGALGSALVTGRAGAWVSGANTTSKVATNTTIWNGSARTIFGVAKPTASAGLGDLDIFAMETTWSDGVGLARNGSTLGVYKTGVAIGYVGTPTITIADDLRFTWAVEAGAGTGQAKLYVNGVLAATWGSTPAWPGSFKPLMIGGETDATDPYSFRGSIGSVVSFPGVLRADDHLRLHQEAIRTVPAVRRAQPA